MSLSRRRDKSNTCQLAPRIGRSIKHPSVIVMILTVRAAKPKTRHTI